LPLSGRLRKIAGIVWQPSAPQWRLIWILTVVIVLFWPGEQDRSLAIKTLNWAADPRNTLPQLPGDLTLDSGDDPEAVTAHDAQEAEYYRVYEGSRVARLRMRLRDMSDPFEPSTQRQILGAIAVLGGLAVWRLGTRPAQG
jgi:hypothetical protein